MPVVIYPRVATGPGRLQVFVADFEARAARPPAFCLDGAAAEPVVLRPLSSVRAARHGVPAGSKVARAFVGVYEFRGLAPGRVYRVEARLGSERQAVDGRVLPARVATDAEGGFDVMLASCFHRDESSSGALARALRQLVASVRPKRGGRRAPDLTLLMGDQVYLDLPTLKDFPDELGWLSASFEQNYRLNWQASLAEVLRVAPFACLPDDHEYWNNAPHPSAQNGNTLTAAGRARWHEAAELCYAAFARPFVEAGGAADAGPPAPSSPGTRPASSADAVDHPLSFDVEPLSFFLADGRSRRDGARRFAFTSACRSALRAWVSRLNRERRVGVFVSGQSLLARPVGGAAGKLADWELPNYGDYREVMAELGRAKQRLLLLTGDVHWGRVTAARRRLTGEPHLHEVVVSPLSLVTTVGADPLKVAWAWLRGVRGRRDPWPRHPGAEQPPAELHLGAGSEHVSLCGVAARADGSPALITGNQLGLLSFDWDRVRLRASVTYFPVHDQLTAPIRVPLFECPLAP